MHWIRRHRRGRPPHPDVLTPAEWRVLEQVREGRANAEIAVRMGVSRSTVRSHLNSIYAKTGIADRQALAQWDGQPAEASRRLGRFSFVGLPWAGMASGTKFVAGGVAAVIFLGAVVSVFAFFAAAEGDDPPGARHVSASVEALPGGIINFSAGGSIYTIRPDGSGLTEVVSGERDSDEALEDGPDLGVLQVGHVRSQQWAAAPAISPNGGTIAFTRAFQVWTVPVDGSAAPTLFAEVADLQPSPGASNWSTGAQSVAWSPSGNALAFMTSRIGGSGVNRGGVVRGGGHIDWLFEEAAYFYHPVWLRGSLLTFYPPDTEPTTLDTTRQPGGAVDLPGPGVALPGPGFAVPLDLDEERWLAGTILDEGPILVGTVGAFVTAEGVWPTPSPDGEWFAYFIGETLRIARLDGSEDLEVIDTAPFGGRDRHFASGCSGEEACSHRVPAISWGIGPSQVALPTPTDAVSTGIETGMAAVESVATPPLADFHDAPDFG